MACANGDGQPFTSGLVRPSRDAGVAAELEDLRKCERRTFSSLDALCQFLREASRSSDSSRDEGADDSALCPPCATQVQSPSDRSSDFCRGRLKFERYWVHFVAATIDQGTLSTHTQFGWHRKPRSWYSRSIFEREQGETEMSRNKILCMSATLLVTAGWASSAVAGRCVGVGGRACAMPQHEAATSATAPARTIEWASGGGTAAIAPIWSSPNGQTYGRWAASWYQWAVGAPAATSPVLDSTGEQCGQRQVGDVWFLAGFFGSETVVRNCAVPAGKSLFFPLINNGYFAFLNDSPETRTEEYVRAAAACTEPAQITIRIDGVRVEHPTRYFTGPGGSQSPLFNVQLPPGNLFGDDGTAIPELLLSPSAEQGYYLFVKPLRPGTHTIKWYASGCTPGATQDITYHLSVK